MKIIIATILLIILNGCSSVPILEIFTKPVERTPLNLKDPNEMNLNDIKWRVISEKNANKIFEELIIQKKDPVLIGLTDKDYEKLALNMEKIRIYIIQYKHILNEYRKYYEGNVDGNQKKNNN